MKKVLGIMVLVVVCAVVTAASVVLACLMLNYGLVAVCISLFVTVLLWAIKEDYDIWVDDHTSLILLRGIILMAWSLTAMIVCLQQMMP